MRYDSEIGLIVSIKPVYTVIYPIFYAANKNKNNVNFKE